MKLRREEITRLAALILNNLKAHSLPNPSQDGVILSRIEGVILKNMEEENAIEDEARKLMEQYKGQMATGAVDPQKAYIMIKKQVAKERKFVL